jgi:hypothetical protein
MFLLWKKSTSGEVRHCCLGSTAKKQRPVHKQESGAEQSVFVSSLTNGRGLVNVGDVSLNVFKQIADAIGGVGDAIKKLTDGVAHLLQTGTRGWDYVRARSAYFDLLNASRTATQLGIAQTVCVLPSLNKYLQEPSDNHWWEVQSSITTVFTQVSSLLSTLAEERSEFILEDGYASLIETLSVRSKLLYELSSMAPPKTADEMAALATVNERYRVLIAQLQDATKQLNSYLKMLDPERVRREAEEARRFPFGRP